MSESTLSKRARKKQAREAAPQGQTSTRSDSIASDTAKKDYPSATSTPPDLDGEFKLREGVNPFVDVLQKKVRNLTKRRVLSIALKTISKANVNSV